MQIPHEHLGYLDHYTEYLSTIVLKFKQHIEIFGTIYVWKCAKIALEKNLKIEFTPGRKMEKILRPRSAHGPGL